MFNLKQFDGLEIFEIYDEYLEPKFFSAVNRWGEYFLVYWSGDYNGGEITKWLVSPISKSRLDALVKLRVSVPEVYRNPERELKVIVHDHRRDVSFYEDNFVDINFPPENFIFEPEDIEPVHAEAKWAFEIGIKKRQSNPPADMVTKVIELVSDVMSALVPDEERRNIKFSPVNAHYGSFNVRLETSDLDSTESAISRLSNIFHAENELLARLEEYRLDSFRLKELIETVVENKAIIKLVPKRPGLIENDELEIRADRVERLLELLSENTRSFVDSIKIPQANNLNRVIDIVVRKVAGLSLDHNEIEDLSSSRQVKYYTDAAFTLDLMKRNAVVTSSGRFLAQLENREQQLRFIADKFETSEVGLAWIQWSGVSSINELDSETATDFIMQCARGLSQDTARRRASTLQHWLNMLSGLSRQYDF